MSHVNCVASLSHTPVAVSRGAPHAWVLVPTADAVPALGEAAGFDTLEQATAVVAVLNGVAAVAGIISAVEGWKW